jgi:hypothetical protein
MKPEIKIVQEMVICVNQMIPSFRLKIIEPREDDNDFEEPKYVVFFDDEQGKKEKDYQDGYASNHSYICQKSDKEWFFTYTVDNPGVRYYKDGTGEPPSVDFVDSDTISTEFYKCLLDLLLFKAKQDILIAFDNHFEKEMQKLEDDANIN